MPRPDYLLLDDSLRPLLNKFYRAHQSPMRAGEGELWIAKQDTIIAGLSLTPVAQGHWLTGLFVAPSHRGQGIATTLVARARAQKSPAPLWLFCHPDLQALYARMGFVAEPALPQALADRLARYRRSKNLIAMGMDPLA